jgi:hypothetical protein
MTVRIVSLLWADKPINYLIEKFKNETVNMLIIELLAKLKFQRTAATDFKKGKESMPFQK